MSNPQPNIFRIPLNNTHVEPSTPSILLTPIVAHDQTPSTHPHPPNTPTTSIKSFLPHLWVSIYLSRVNLSPTFLLGIQSILSKPTTFFSPIASFIPNSSTSAWAWVLALHVLGSFRFGFHCPSLYNCIHIVLRRDV
jgi:hypothetical protein